MGYVFSKPSCPGFCPRDLLHSHGRFIPCHHLCFSASCLFLSLQRECIWLLIGVTFLSQWRVWQTRKYFPMLASQFTSLFSHQISRKLCRTETKEHTVLEAPSTSAQVSWPPFSSSLYQNQRIFRLEGSKTIEIKDLNIWGCYTQMNS